MIVLQYWYLRLIVCSALGVVGLAATGQGNAMSQAPVGIPRELAQFRAQQLANVRYQT